MESTTSSSGPYRKGGLAALTLGAIGIVYGDIGTSPLYTVREVFNPETGLALNTFNILGALSLIFWSLILVVTIKYVLLILRVDNKGEGGVMALAALAARGATLNAWRRKVVFGLGMVGIALFYGDGIITPAISVLSAVEGLNLATPLFNDYILPLSVAILIGLFLGQRYGTRRVGKIFGPALCVWFLVLAVLGAIQIHQQPQVLAALNPVYALAMFEVYGIKILLILGAVVLAVTGAEALYADLGHFGRTPIKLAWFGLVLPALVVNYFGQGALLLRQPGAIANPFYHLVPAWGLYPMVILATMATVIASQAVISGAFSLTRQAIQMGFLPRMAVRHTSEENIGQIYIPAINWALLFGVIFLVIEFKSSGNLAAAYGVAVTGVMTVTTALAFVAYSRSIRWPVFLVAPIFIVFLAVDLAFASATSLKIFQGGWMPLTVAFVLFMLMSIWRRGRKLLSNRLYGHSMTMKTFIEQLSQKHPVSVPGTAIFMTADAHLMPRALLHNLRHNKVLHERNILMTIMTEEVPTVSSHNRVKVIPLGRNIYAVTAHYGFAQQPNVPEALRLCKPFGLDINIAEASFFLNRETLIASPVRDLPLWQDWIFIGMSSFAADATGFFRIPVNRVVEMGSQLEI